MKTYLMRMEAGAAATQWEMRFEMASDEMAKNYVHRIVKTDRAVKALGASIVLFNEKDGVFLAEYGLAAPTVVEVERRR